MKKIVIPYDFSAEAELALDAAIQYAQIDPSELHMLHVVEVPSSYLSLYPEYGSLDLESVFDDDILKSIDQRLQSV
ncbi:MAG: universal stress protein, partial [Cyclobacteriaceae bacterium]